MNKIIIAMLAIVLLLIPGVGTAQDEQLPMNPPPGYYGSLTVNGQPAPAGTVMTARVGGEERGSITTTGSGFYGDNPGPVKFWIRGYQNEIGTTVTFYINGVAAQQTAGLPGAGTTSRVDLAFVGVPVSAAGASGGSSGSSSSSNGSTSKEGNTGGTAIPTAVTAVPTAVTAQVGITPAATDVLKVSGETSKTAQGIDPTAIIGAVTLLFAAIITASYLRRK